MKKKQFQIQNSVVNFDRIQNTFTSKRNFFQRLDSSEVRLVDYLISVMPHIDTESWRKRFLLGGIFVNGIPANFDDIIKCVIKNPDFELDKIKIECSEDNFDDDTFKTALIVI